MAQQLSGAPKVVVDVTDKSLLFSRDSVANYCVMGVTSRGKVGEPAFIKNRAEFIRTFGNRIEESDFPYYCMRILDQGAKLWVSRVGHYADVADKTTLEGAKGTAKVSDGGAGEVRGTASIEITDKGAVGDTWNITVNNGVSNLTVASYPVVAGDSEAVVAQGLINSLTDGYEATSGVSATIVLQAPIGTGAAANAYTIGVVTSGSGTDTSDSNFSGGVDAVENAVLFEAEEVGDGYNGSTISIAASASLDPTTVDITVVANGSDIDTVVKDFPANPTANQLDKLNKKFKTVQVVAVFNSAVLAIGSAVVGGGSMDYAAINDSDYVGDSTQGNGWWSFGSVTNAFRIANIDRPSPTVDIALVNYVMSRKGGDMRVHIATPIGITPDGAKDYRKGEGIYVHNPIDNWIASLWAGQVNVNDPSDSEASFDIQGIVDFLGQRAKTDTKEGYWWSTAGPKRGKISAPNNGTGEPNYISPKYLDQFNNAYPNGINAIVDDETYGTVVWGNRSLLANGRSLLSKENVADVAMYFKRALEPAVRTEMFDPNDPLMWKQIYRNVLPIIEDVVANRGIRPTEGEGWFWEGDQEANTADEAVFNTQNDIDNGIYKARFIFVPIAAVEYIGIDVVVTDSNSVATIVANPQV